MSARLACALCLLVNTLANLQGVTSEKVSFPETPRSLGSAAVPAAAPAAAESRLVADADGAFGLSSSSPRPRNLAVFGQERRGPDCPLCDPSVFSYCNDRLLHDACCCLAGERLPPQCQYADCSFLHAKTCYEHRLITRCCCDRRLF